MNTNLKLTFALAAGAVIGLLGAQAIQAQAPKPAPAYIIAEVEKNPDATPNPEGMKRYGEVAPKTIAEFGGRYVVRGSKVETLEGAAPKGYIVVIGFDSLAKAQAWYNSPAYAAVRPIRQAATHSRLLLVEGVAPQ